MVKRKWNKLILTAGLLALFVGFSVMTIFTTNEVIERQVEYVEARNEYDKLREVAGVDKIHPPCADEPQEEGIDWDALFAINPNVVGWIIVPNTDISYPIVQGADNRHYLRHTFNGTHNASGAVFLDYRDTPDFQGVARVYAHNMRDGSMFAPLFNWHGESFIIHTTEGTFTFDVTFQGAVATSNAVFTANHVEDEIILVTCVNGSPNQRFIIRATLNHPLDNLSESAVG